MSINLFVTCANRKRLPPHPSLRARAWRNLGIERRVEHWTQALASGDGMRLPARDMYQGVYWSIVRSLIDRPDVTVWIVSAGYGLLTPSQVIHSYAATFDVSNVDAIVESPDLRPVWWEYLATAALASGISRIREVAERNEGPLLVALSPGYLSAVQNDLAEAIERLADRDRAVVLTTSSRIAEVRPENVVRFDARLSDIVRGPMQSLTARVAQSLIERVPHADLSPQRVATEIRELMHGRDPFRYPSRARRDDEAVTEFIRSALLEDGNATASRLLRRYRDSGLACEQGRFAALFRAVREDRIGG